MIFFEGADGTGKTETIKKLYQEGYITVAVPKNNKNIINAYYELARTAKSNTIITDRSFICDLIYRLEDGKKHSGVKLFDMVSFVKNNKCIIILCETDTCYEDSMKRGEDSITTKERSKRIIQLYRDVCNMFSIFAGVEVRKYNWRTDSFDELLNYCKEKEV